MNYKKPLTEEEEKEEFNTLYQLLSTMVSKSTSQGSSMEETRPSLPSSLEKEPSSSLVFSNEIIAIHPLSVTRKGRPKKIHEKERREKIAKKKEKIECEVCKKKIKRRTFEHGYEHSEICKQWYLHPEKNELKQPVTELFHNKINQLIRDCMEMPEHPPFHCVHCQSSFSTRTNLTTHFTSSVACNHLAYLTFKKKVMDL